MCRHRQHLQGIWAVAAAELHRAGELAVAAVRHLGQHTQVDLLRVGVRNVVCKRQRPAVGAHARLAAAAHRVLLPREATADEDAVLLLLQQSKRMKGVGATMVVRRCTIQWLSFSIDRCFM